jgi:isopentenyl-diphosphate delta-isomerase
MSDLLILVDENDRETGVMEKFSVHQAGLLHRAFSLFIFNSAGELLLQQRADEKYHSAGLWSNTCCSHPIKGENISDTINRRLGEEMGMQSDMDFRFSFIYRTGLEHGLTEHEFDHVYFGTSDIPPVGNPLEVKDWKYMSLPDLDREISLHPEDFTAWLKICLPKINDHFNKTNA